MATKLKSQALSDEARDWLKGYFDGLYAASGHLHTDVYSPATHNHSGVYAPDSHQHTANQVIYHHLNGSMVPAGGTYYIIPSIANFSTLNGLVWPIAGTFTNMAVRIHGIQPASGTMVITLQKNLVDTACVVTVPANAPAGANYYSSSPAAWALYDLFTVKVKNNATATSAPVTSWSILFQSAAA